MPVLQAFPDKPLPFQQSVSDVEFTAAWEIKMATMMFCSLDFDGIMHDALLYVLGRY